MTVRGLICLLAAYKLRHPVVRGYRLDFLVVDICDDHSTGFTLTAVLERGKPKGDAMGERLVSFIGSQAPFTAYCHCSDLADLYAVLTGNKEAVWEFPDETS